MVVRRAGKLMPLDRHPLVVFLLGWAVLVGVGGVLSLLSGQPRPPGGQLPAWLDITWYALLGAGAVLALVGTFWRDPIHGVLLARAGYWPTGTGGLIYSCCLLASGQPRSALIIAAFSAACIWRAASIRKDVRAELVGP